MQKFFEIGDDDENISDAKQGNHDKTRNFKCQMCAMMFTRKYNLQRHVNIQRSQENQ